MPNSKTIVILIDGTLSSLAPGYETNVGLIKNLLKRDASLRLFYQEGLQWSNPRSGFAVLTGNGINDQIRAGYGALASWYRPGDQVFLIGFSRGAYAVRSLAGVVQRVGLLRQEFATTRRVAQAFRHYRRNPNTPAARKFADSYCRADTAIQAIGAFDTVKALGVRLPGIWRFFNHHHSFHDHHLGADTKAGFHALALDERRVAYAPILWDSDPKWTGTLEQVWFRGGHSDVGGQLKGADETRPLSNIPLVWMLEKLEEHGLPLPENWQDNFPMDHTAPAVDPWAGSKKLFLSRAPRKFGEDPSESLHPSAFLILPS